MKSPQTRYARNGDIHIAYQVASDGSPDLLHIPGWMSHVEVGWDFPPMARFYSRLASSTRFIMMDKRGTGASDRAVDSMALEDQLDDVRAVLDDVASERAFLFGTMDGGGIALLFAATFPERVLGVITFGSRARMMFADDYPWGTQPGALEELIASIEPAWSDDDVNRKVARSFNPSMDEPAIDWALRWQKVVGSPGTATALTSMYASIDIRPVLPTIKVPVLVLNQEFDVFTTADHARYLADHLPNARLALLPGQDFVPVRAFDAAAEEIEEFVTGQRRDFEPDRVFATLLVTDFVNSTERAAQVGDRSWRELLDRHDDVVRRQLERFRGTLVKSTGDGIVASFDGPGRAIRCAIAVREAVASLGIDLRLGLHAGEVELRGEDVSGLAIVIASRVMNLAGSQQILVSSTVRDLVVGSGIEFADRGMHTLKGVPGEWRLYEVSG